MWSRGRWDKTLNSENIREAVAISRSMVSSLADFAPQGTHLCLEKRGQGVCVWSAEARHAAEPYNT